MDETEELKQSGLDERTQESGIGAAAKGKPREERNRNRIEKGWESSHKPWDVRER